MHRDGNPRLQGGQMRKANALALPPHTTSHKKKRLSCAFPPPSPSRAQKGSLENVQRDVFLRERRVRRRSAWSGVSTVTCRKEKRDAGIAVGGLSLGSACRGGRSFLFPVLSSSNWSSGLKSLVPVWFSFSRIFKKERETQWRKTRSERLRPKARSAGSDTLHAHTDERHMKMLTQADGSL
uniref:Uncharacterized protein n=1 Tax=Toxoplasma gondii COUG TaxID=1074873 RepID=A0A2G8XXH7_TOXGO|nr:hypothetical protein TGCOUG_394010 [Toxoplasma gondii COUG]